MNRSKFLSICLPPVHIIFIYLYMFKNIWDNLQKHTAIESTTDKRILQLKIVYYVWLLPHSIKWHEVYANRNKIIISLEKYRKLAIGRAKYSGISERGEADGNMTLTKILEKLNNLQHKVGKWRDHGNMSFPRKTLEGPQDEWGGNERHSWIKTLKELYHCKSWCITYSLCEAKGMTPWLGRMIYEDPPQCSLGSKKSTTCS